MIRQYASAGAVVLTADPTTPQVLLLDQTRTTGERQTVAPKGRIEPGEGPLAAAFREVDEEAGATDLRYAGYLGREGYTFTDNDGTPAAKTVDWFLAVTDTTTAHARTVEGFTTARWYPIADAIDAASHPAFHPYLRRAAAIAAWRATRPLPYSLVVDRVVRDVADAAQPLLASHTGAGLAVCGSAARGDAVDGWSDIDLIGWALPATAPAVDTLGELIRDVAARHTVRVSLHLAEVDAPHLGTTGPGHDLKLRTALQRIGVDVAVIAGVAPTTIPAAPTAAQLQHGLAGLRDFATTRLAQRGADPADRRDRARRALSAACSAARLLALTLEPGVGLRLPEVTDLLAAHHPGTPIEGLLRAYDTVRRTGAHDLEHAEHLAEQVPHAINDLTRVIAASVTR